MDNPTPKWSELFVRWNKAGWPVLAMRPEQIPAAPAPKTEVAAKQEWDAEGGAIKPSPATAEPKLPL
jgi:hypothetical protein